MTNLIASGDHVLLTLEGGKTFLVRMQEGLTHSTHHGAVRHDDIIGRDWGDVLLSSTGKALYLLKPRGIDRMMKVKRRTNIMYPKDVAYLLAELDVRPGDRVVEIGSGSGSMTQALARAVSPGGQVFSYDRRPEFSELARENCEVAGVGDVVEFRAREAGDPLEPDVDAVFTDVPEPWNEVAVIYEALRGSGRFAAGVPTFNQAEQLAVALERGGFAMIETVEILVRSILARRGKTRPAHRMIGHTQLLVSAVKIQVPRTAAGAGEAPKDGPDAPDQDGGEEE